MSEIPSNPLFTTLLQYEQELRRFLLRRLGCRHQTADLFQDMAERILQRESENPANPRAYLFQTASNAIVDYRRTEGCRLRHVDQCQMDDSELDQRGPERIAVAHETVSMIETALAQLPPLTRQIFYLYRLDGMSQHAIAAQLRISRSTVERRLEHAISHWRATLEGDDRLAEDHEAP